MTSRHRGRRVNRTTHRDDERGAAALFLSVMMVIILPMMGGMVFDIGKERVARADMQAVADMVALDMSRLVDGSTKAAIEARPSWALTLSRSTARNSGTLTGTPTVTAVLGVFKVTDGSFVPLTSAQGTVVPDAVQVSAQSDVSFAFGLATGARVSKSAIGSSQSTACFRLGSYAARFGSGNSALFKSLLESALGGSVNVTAASYQGLALAEVKLSDLATALSVGTVDGLSSATVTVQDFYLAVSSALQSRGDTLNASLVHAMAVGMSARQSIQVGQLLAITPGSNAALTATVKALDLLAGSAFLANGSSLAVGDVGASLGLSNSALHTSAAILQGAQTGCGRVGATAKTAQGDLTVTGKLANPATPAALTGLNLVAQGQGTDISVHLASASGALSAIVCGDGTSTSPEGVDVAVTSQLATVSQFSQTLHVDGNMNTPAVLSGVLGGLLGTLTSVKVVGDLTITAQSSQPAGTSTASIRIPNAPTSYDLPVSTGGGSLGLNPATITATWTSGPNLVASGLTGPTTLTSAQSAKVSSAVTSNIITSLITPIVNSVNTTLVQPLADLLGLRLAGADVFGVPRPSCTSAQLVA